jgi:hypothetical protein
LLFPWLLKTTCAIFPRRWAEDGIFSYLWLVCIMESVESFSSSFSSYLRFCAILSPFPIPAACLWMRISFLRRLADNGLSLLELKLPMLLGLLLPLFELYFTSSILEYFSVSA